VLSSKTILLSVLSVTFLTSCSKGEDVQQTQSGAQVGEDSAVGASAGSVEATAQSINPQPRENLLQGGELRLRLGSIAENWNPLHVDGNSYDYALVREPMLPVFFDFDAEGVPTPNPDYVVSVEVVAEEPTVIRYILNPE